jgi:hypothetical protein
LKSVYAVQTSLFSFSNMRSRTGQSRPAASRGQHWHWR